MKNIHIMLPRMDGNGQLSVNALMLIRMIGAEEMSVNTTYDEQKKPH